MDSLNYWKGLFNIFRKDVTIKKSDTKTTSINIENNTSDDIQRTSRSPTKASLSNEDSKNITEFDGVLETPRFDLFDLVQSNLDKDSSDTTEGLKEFNEILQEVNVNILNDEQVSLDDIDNVLNNINEVENPKQDYLELETPTFEQQDLNQTINLCRKYSNASNYFDNNKQSINLNETNDPNNFDENKASEGDHTININANLDKADIISISSKNSQESNEILISAENTITLQTKVNNNSKEPLLATQDKETNNDNKESKNTDFNTPTNLIDETKEINRPISPDVSDDDCGYHSSDFEFITEDEAKLDGIIINFNPKKLKIQKTDTRRKVKTYKIAIDNFAGQRIEVTNKSLDSGPSLRRERPEGEDPRPSNSQKNKDETVNFLSGSNKGPEVHPELNNINTVSAQRSGSNLRYFRRKRPNNFGHSSKISQNPEAVDNFKQNNNEDGKTVENRNSFGPTIQINCTEACNVLQINYHKNNTRNNSLGFKNLQSKYPTSTEDRWRDFQYRNRLIRQEFESNRENHRIFEGDEYYSLFAPNFGPLPNQSSIRFLENKSTMSGSMLVEYQGIGFNMQMLRDMDENETDEVRDEANKCARKIFEMYPGENRRKRRRF